MSANDVVKRGRAPQGKPTVARRSKGGGARTAPKPKTAPKNPGNQKRGQRD